MRSRRRLRSLMRRGRRIDDFGEAECLYNNVEIYYGYRTVNTNYFWWWIDSLYAYRYVCR